MLALNHWRSYSAPVWAINHPARFRTVAIPHRQHLTLRSDLDPSHHMLSVCLPLSHTQVCAHTHKRTCRHTHMHTQWHTHTHSQLLCVWWSSSVFWCASSPLMPITSLLRPCLLLDQSALPSLACKSYLEQQGCVTAPTDVIVVKAISSPLVVIFHHAWII